MGKKEARKQPNLVIPIAIVIFIVLMVVGIVIKTRGSRGMCTYDSVYRKVTCKAKQLRVIPTDITEGALTLHMGTKLDKQENYFTVLTPGNFSRFTHLQELRLIKCGIEEIKPETFRPLAVLRRLDLRYNRIQVITEDTFRGLSSLEYLYLSNNPIQKLEDYIFRGLRIENLVLANNPDFSEISSKAFTGAIIKSIVINRCNIAVMPMDTFSYISDSLQELYITHNLQALPLIPGIFKNLRLKKLVLSNSGLEDEDFLQGISAEEISLNDNPLEEFDCQECPLLKDTKRIFLSKTKLSKITKENFLTMTGLEELDLDGNDLTIFNATVFEDMTNLKVLDLSENDLEDWDGNYSLALPKLQSLFLHGNNIETLPEGLQPLFSHLTNLTLHDNPLHCNCEVRWFAKWMEHEDHRQILQNLDAVSCETPENRNFTQISDYGFQCRAPTIFNATIDTDGISLLCTAAGDPAPRVVWVSPDGKKKAKEPARSDRDVFQTQSSLTITKKGNYTCIAQNIAGEDRISVNTRNMPSSGFKYHVESNEIEILQNPYGLGLTISLIALLGYILRIDSLYDKDGERRVVRIY